MHKKYLVLLQSEEDIIILQTLRHSLVMHNTSWFSDLISYILVLLYFYSVLQCILF